jgi:peptidoglycan/LPS O-acetylase OafA/YrhL
LAILSVLYSHGGFSSGFPHFSWWPFDGSPGVSVFFILTGLLVTTILLDEQEKAGKVSLRNFFIRRGLRIWPALYAFLAVAWLLRAVGFIEFNDMAWIASATHWMNLYNGPNTWPLSHMWSLSLQESFYLVWPIVVTRMPVRKSLWLCIALIVGWPLVRFLAHGEAAPWPAHLALDNNGMNTIFYGALLALMMRDHACAQYLRRFSHIATLIVSVGLITLLYLLHEVWPHSLAGFLAPLRNLSVLAVVWWSINNRKHWIGQLLEARPLVYLGAISFSVYLWQQFFLSPNPGWITAFPQNLIFALVVGAASYHLCEVPARALGTRFRARYPRRHEAASALVNGRKDLAVTLPSVEPIEAVRSSATP